MAVAAVLALLAGALVAWSYILYPAVLTRLASRAPAPAPHPPLSPSVEVLVSAFDEERVIGERVRNLLAQEYPGSYRISIGCDGCRDKTALRAREAGDTRVRVAEFPVRRGKAAVLNDLLRDSSAELIVFTDANTRFEPAAISRLAEAFADPEVGAVCGRLLLEPRGDLRQTPEMAFWNRETRWKEAEGKLGVCLGANGAIYAARRDLIALLPEDTAMDDFLIPVRIARAGKKVVFRADAVAREDAAADLLAEVSRRFRLGVGAGQVLRRERWLFDYPRHPMLTFAFLSRKLARWIAPLAALLAAVAALFVPELRAVGALTLLVSLLLLLLALARPHLRGLSGRLYYFGVINLALAAGLAAGLAGYRQPLWKRTVR